VAARCRSAAPTGRTITAQGNALIFAHISADGRSQPRQGRQKVATGVSPWTGRTTVQPPQGAAQRRRPTLLPPPAGAGPCTRPNPRLTPWATTCRPPSAGYGARDVGKDEGNALGIGERPCAALKGRTMAGSVVRPFRAERTPNTVSQGVALGCHSTLLRSSAGQGQAPELGAILPLPPCIPSRPGYTAGRRTGDPGMKWRIVLGLPILHASRVDENGLSTRQLELD